MTRGLGLCRTELLGALCGAAVAVTACGAVYPEVSTPVRASAKVKDLEPAPPEELLYLTFKSAKIPPRTRDGRHWDTGGGSAPDPVAMLFVNDREIIKTPVHPDTVEPTWPDQRRANYRIPRDARVRVELWDANALNNDPICIKKVRRIHSKTTLGETELRCNSGARIVLGVEPAHARLGLGFYYELRSDSIVISRVLAESPASRAGLERGMEILSIQGKPVQGMDDGEARSLINTNGQLGLELELRGPSGRHETVEVKEGPIYPLESEPIDLG